MADNENITDLTEEEDSGGEVKENQSAEPKPPKAPKARKAPAVSPPFPEMQAGGKKKKKKGKLKLILILVLVVLVVGFVAEEIIFNYLGIRNIFIDAVISLDPEYGDREQKYLEIEADLTRWENELTRREQAAISRENSNERRRIELNLREEEIIEKELLDTPPWRRFMTEQELRDMQAYSGSLRPTASMTAEDAAEILANMERMEDVAAILHFMSERDRGAILRVMDPEFAAEIVEMLLPYR